MYKGWRLSKAGNLIVVQQNKHVVGYLGIGGGVTPEPKTSFIYGLNNILLEIDKVPETRGYIAGLDSISLQIDKEVDNRPYIAGLETISLSIDKSDVEDNRPYIKGLSNIVLEIDNDFTPGDNTPVIDIPLLDWYYLVTGGNQNGS